MTKRKEVPVKHHPGIYKRFIFHEPTQKWIDTGKYRVIRRIVVDGGSSKEQAVFDSLEDAKAFRLGILEKSQIGANTPRNTLLGETEGLTFGALVEKWKPFHFLRLERGSRQSYEKRLPNLDYLKLVPVEKITTTVIDDMVAEWVGAYPKGGQRQTFEKELNLLNVILNFYRKRMNPSYLVPILDEHYQAGDMAKRAVQPVQSLTQEELSLFLEDLKKSKSPIFYSMAMAQFCLGLRIGELCGMAWDAMDLEHGIARIEWTIEWDQNTWEPRIKVRPKNGKVRILVLPEVLALELERLKAIRDPKVPLIFHCKGKPMNRQTVAKAYNRALLRLGFKHVRGTHMLRKTSATLANEVTGDFYAVSKLMDHSSPNVTLRYVAQTNAGKQKVARALNGILQKEVTESGILEPIAGNFRTRKTPSTAAVPQRPPRGTF